MCFWQSAKQVMDVVAPVVTVIAIMVGGFWTYKLFIQNRQNHKKARISHHIFYVKLNDEKALLHVELKLSNIGSMLIKVERCETYISQILPLTDSISKPIEEKKGLVGKNEHEAEFETIDGVEILYKERANPAEGNDETVKHIVNDSPVLIEPGEEDSIGFDFLIESDVQTVLVYSYISSEKIHRREYGWSLSTIYDINKEMLEGSK